MVVVVVLILAWMCDFPDHEALFNHAARHELLPRGVHASGNLPLRKTGFSISRQTWHSLAYKQYVCTEVHIAQRLSGMPCALHTLKITLQVEWSNSHSISCHFTGIFQRLLGNGLPSQEQGIWPEFNSQRGV